MYVTVSVYFVGRSDDDTLVFNVEADSPLAAIKTVCDGCAVEDIDGTWHGINASQILHVEAYDATDFLGAVDKEGQPCVSL